MAKTTFEITTRIKPEMQKTLDEITSNLKKIAALQSENNDLLLKCVTGSIECVPASEDTPE